MAKKIIKKAKKAEKVKKVKTTDKVKIAKKNVKKPVAKKIEKVVKETKKRGRPRKNTIIDDFEDEVMTRPVFKPTKPAYSKEELNYFRKIINDKREEIVRQLESLRDRLIDASTGQYVNENSPYSLHMAELGTDAMEKEKNYLFTQRETKFLGYLDEALERIEDGTYGYCIDCGVVIPKGRLEAVPHSQHCLNCKTKFGK